MKDFEVTLRIKNNQLKQRRLALGMNCEELAKAAGISLGAYHRLEAMRMSAVRRRNKMEWRPTALALATFYRVSVLDLFPDSIREIEEPVAVRVMDGEEIRQALSSHQENAALPPDEVLERQHLEGTVGRVLEMLTPREEHIVRERFGFNGLKRTLADVADEQGVSVERIKQIEGKAIRKLQHPSRAGLLADAVGYQRRRYYK